jgi:hypothetical protein
MLTVMTYNVGAGLTAPLRLVDGLYVTNPYSMDLAARIRAKNLAAKAIAAYRARMRDARDAMDEILIGGTDDALPCGQLALGDNRSPRQRAGVSRSGRR